MKTTKEAIILTERAADHGRLRAVLREWGYREDDIHRVLKEQRIDYRRDYSSESADRAITAHSMGATLDNMPRPAMSVVTVSKP